MMQSDAASRRQRQSRLTLTLTGAAGLLFVLIAYLMWSLAQRERTLRRAAETMAPHARVIGTLREGVLLVGIAQDLTGIALLLKGVGGKSQSDASTLEFIVGHVNHVLERACALARGLSPIQVAGGSLSLALSRFAAEISAASSIEVVCRSELDGLHLGTTQSDHLYRIAQECVRM